MHATFAPLRPNAIAAAAPIPVLAPVISTTLFLRSSIIFSPTYFT